MGWVLFGFLQRSSWEMAGVPSWCLHRGVQHCFTPSEAWLYPSKLLVPFPRCLSEDFYTRCEMLNFQLILKLSLSILLTWCLKKQSPAPILASGTFAVEEGVGREELLPLVSVVSLLIPFGREEKYCIPLWTFLIFMENFIRKMKISSWVSFIGLNRWILIATPITKLSQLYFH